MNPVVVPEDCVQHLRGHRIFITGGYGFVGTNLRNMCSAYSIPCVTVRHCEMNLEVEGTAERFLKERDYVVHLAAHVGGIQKNIDDGASMFTQNLRMGMNLIDSCVKARVGKVLIVGTACAYPESATLPLREEDIWSGLPSEETGGYGMAKRMLLYQAQAFFGPTTLFPSSASARFPIVHVIPTNLYGPHDRFHPTLGHVIPSMIARMRTALLDGAPEFVIWGDGKQTRDFLHVDDACRGILLALDKAASPHAMNLATGRETTILELAEIIKRALKYQGKLVFNPKKPVGVKRRVLDTQRARQRLDFNYDIDLEEGLSRLIREGR